VKYLLFSEYYITDGTIYFLDLQSDEFDTMLFPDPQHPPYISSFSFAPNGDLYYVRPNIDSPWSIRKAPTNTNNFPTDIDHLNFSVIYEATIPELLNRVRVRQVNSSQIRIYFSRSYAGENKDGQIYYLKPSYKNVHTGQMMYVPVPYYTVKLDQIPADFGLAILASMIRIISILAMELLKEPLFIGSRTLGWTAVSGSTRTPIVMTYSVIRNASTVERRTTIYAK
jgi:hypothetical protein